ncbi:hypothetical protein [Candidatus Palauibacter sp.]
MPKRIDDGRRDSGHPGYDVCVHVERDGEDDGDAPEVHVRARRYM